MFINKTFSFLSFLPTCKHIEKRSYLKSQNTQHIHTHLHGIQFTVWENKRLTAFPTPITRGTEIRYFVLFKTMPLSLLSRASLEAERLGESRRK